DLFSEGAQDSFAALAPNGRAFDRMGPAEHGPIGGDLMYPQRNLPKGVQLPTLEQVMTGESPKSTRSLLVYYLMGDTRDPDAPGNIWMVSPVWPVLNTATDYFLHRDGTLSRMRSTEKDGSLTYAY